MLRRSFLKLLGVAIAVPVVGWIPKRAFRDTRWNVWLGRGSGDWLDPQSWSLGAIPRRGDRLLFDACSGNLVENLDQVEATIVCDSITISKDFAGTIGEQGKTL